MADTGPVKIRTGKIEQLIELYKATYKKLVEEIITASESGKIQKARTMARINFELEQLGVDVEKWVRREIPQYYLDGANKSVQDLRKLGVDVTKSSGLAPINRDAIAALTDEVSTSFAESIKSMSRNARRLLTEAEKQQITLTLAQGKLEGSALKTVASNVAQLLKDQGLGALVDRGGKNWSFDTYAEMLVRTKAVEARNTGMANRMLQNGYDLVQVTDHGSDHPACAEWEGEILSVSGQTEGYATVADAQAAGLFHPNCEHAINPIDLKLAEKTEAYDNPYNYRDQ
jgi:hypothetical protein